MENISHSQESTSSDKLPYLRVYNDEEGTQVEFDYGTLNDYIEFFNALYSDEVAEAIANTLPVEEKEEFFRILGYLSGEDSMNKPVISPLDMSNQN